MSNIPGIPARHAIVTDTCRTNHTDEGAIREAADRLIAQAIEEVGFAPIGEGVKFHFVLTVERSQP